MMSLFHWLLVTGLLPSQHGLTESLISGLALIGCFALLLGLGYMLLGPLWVRRHTHLH